jgi:hypothetical protein
VPALAQALEFLRYWREACLRPEPASASRTGNVAQIARKRQNSEGLNLFNVGESGMLRTRRMRWHERSSCARAKRMSFSLFHEQKQNQECAEKRLKGRLKAVLAFGRYARYWRTKEAGWSNAYWWA